MNHTKLKTVTHQYYGGRIFTTINSTTAVPAKKKGRFRMGQRHRSWHAFLLRFNMYLFLAQYERVYLFLAIAHIDVYLFFFFLFFPMPFIIFALLFSLPPSRNSDPGSHSRLFSPPTHYGSCLAFLSWEDFSSFFPRRLAWMQPNYTRNTTMVCTGTPEKKKERQKKNTKEKKGK